MKVIQQLITWGIRKGKIGRKEALAYRAQGFRVPFIPPEPVFDELFGDSCPYDDCDGQLRIEPPENCYCHLGKCAPCSSCTAPRIYCETSDWREEDDPDWMPDSPKKPRPFPIANHA